MEDYIQFSAKTKNEAITKACLELGTSSDQRDHCFQPYRRRQSAQ